MFLILTIICIVSLIINLITIFKLSENLDRLQQHMIDYEMLEMRLTQLIRKAGE